MPRAVLDGVDVINPCVDEIISDRTFLYNTHEVAPIFIRRERASRVLRTY